MSEARIDTITDFDWSGDRFGLADGLQFEDLSFADNNILSGNEVLATLNGFSTDRLSSSNFKGI